MFPGATQNADNLSTIFDPATCTRKGLCPVKAIRKQDDNPLESHSLYFEQHGSGKEKVVFIMGWVLFGLGVPASDKSETV